MRTEFEFIEAIRQKSKIKNQKSKIKFGIGDDCAVIKKDGKTDLVITTDLLVEDIDFRLDWTKPEFLGHKALAVSLSDVAAMGAKPVWALVSVGVPQKIWNSDFLERFYQGWFDLARKFEVELAGGDVSRTPAKIVIDSIVAGEVKKNQAILRSGAKAGDLIFVSGKLGGAAAGLRLLKSGEHYNPKRVKHGNLFRRQLTPLPQVEIGRKLGEMKLATAMIDLSDGLSSDLAHLCAASRVGAKIEAEKIPLAKNIDSMLLALDGGEDFELLFTANPKNSKKIEKNFASVTQIGEITSNAEKIELVRDSEVVLIEPRGFRHF